MVWQAETNSTGPQEASWLTIQTQNLVVGSPMVTRRRVLNIPLWEVKTDVRTNCPQNGGHTDFILTSLPASSSAAVDVVQLFTTQQHISRTCAPNFTQ